MKSPAELKDVLCRQWKDAAKREARLLNGAEAWPVTLTIGVPKADAIKFDLDAVRRHVREWRRVEIGEVVWEAVPYRATEEAVAIPRYWKLHRPSDWITACNDRGIREEFESMSAFVEQADASFHSTLVRMRFLWKDKPREEVLQACRLAAELEPGCANEKPLRSMSIAGIDTKFFERNARLVTALLDARFDGEVKGIGLEDFLGALPEGDHWVMVMDLDGGLLPFQKQRVRSAELKDTPLPGERLLIVENETCHLQLPAVPETIAVLGAGFDLEWTAGRWLQTKQVGYWGDIDTWGLQFLAAARQSLPQLEALMMTPKIYEQYMSSAVREAVVAGTDVPANLTPTEEELYRRLLSEPSKGRLEQQFLPDEAIRASIESWLRR